MLPSVSSMATFHMLGQNDQKKMQHDIFGHVMPLAPALASSDANGIISAPVPLFSHDN